MSHCALSLSMPWILWEGLRSRSRGHSWSRSESTVLPGDWVGAGVGKILPTPTPARSRRVPPVNRQWFWPNGYASSRKHSKRDEKEGGSVEIKLKRQLAIEFCLIWGIGDNFRVTAIVLWLWQQIQRLSYRVHLKETAIISAGFIRSYRQRMLYHPIARLDTNKREMIKLAISHCFFRMETPLLGQSRSGVGVGVGVDIFRPESELLKIRRLRIRDKRCFILKRAIWYM